MSPACIVTDNTAQFPQPAFPGRVNVHVLPFRINLNGMEESEATPFKANNLPAHPYGANHPNISPPSADEFQQYFSLLEKKYDHVIGIFLSSKLNKYVDLAEESVSGYHNNGKIQIIDSQTTSIGLGYLVQLAAEAITRGTSPVEIERLVRAAIPRIYAVLCTPSLSYLQHSGILDPGQAVIGEMLGIHPIFTIEDGDFTPVDKVRNHRHTIDFFQEFLDEFDTLQHIALLQSAFPITQDTRLFREHIQNNFARIPFTEHTISTALATLIGPTTTGLFLIESNTRKLHLQ